jgi:hypothetical protein
MKELALICIMTIFGAACSKPKSSHKENRRFTKMFIQDVVNTKEHIAVFMVDKNLEYFEKYVGNLINRKDEVFSIVIHIDICHKDYQVILRDRSLKSIPYKRVDFE